MKSKKIILTSHCILNQNSVIEGWARARGAFPISRLLLDEGVGILQLPCPELLFHGINRPPLKYEDYNTKEYRRLCRELFMPYIPQLEAYIANGYELLGILGIYNSPTCSISGKRGVFMEEIFKLCEQHRLLLRYAEIPEDYTEQAADENLENEILQLIRGINNETFTD